jgi:hypothetical protein
MSSNAQVNGGDIPSTKHMVWCAVGAFAISAAVLYLDVWLDFPETPRPLFSIAYLVSMLVTSGSAALAVTSILRLVALGWWRVIVGFVTGLLTFGVSFVLLANLQFLFGGHK